MIFLWTRQDIEIALNIKISQDFQATKICLDSRNIEKDDLFIGLKGPLHDGSIYTSQAFEKGAIAAIVPKNYHQKDQSSLSCEGILIPVNDTLEALEKLAQYARSRTEAKIIGITGSFGKTSVKEALRLVLGQKQSVTASEKSFNNHWGVPLTLTHIKPKDDFGIIEMGMNHKGEIEHSTFLVRPDIALITTVREMHRKNFDTPHGIAEAKCEIFKGMTPEGYAIINLDDPYSDFIKNKAQEHRLKIISFGKSLQAHFQLVKSSYEQGILNIQAKINGQLKEFQLNGLGEHWALNSLGILAVLSALDQDIDEAILSLQLFRLPEGRGAQHRILFQDGEILIIDESYNAGPDSMRAALTLLGQIIPKTEGRRIAILGDMNELGDDAITLHQKLKDNLIENKIDLVFACGTLMQHLYEILPKSMQGKYEVEPSSLIPEILRTIKKGDVIMSKGSKGQYTQRGKMYAFVEALLNLNSTKNTISGH